MPENDKRCRQCGIRKPLREYDLPRHRLCRACRTRSLWPIVERASQKPAPDPPAVVPLTGMDSWLRYKNQSVEYYRQRKRDKESLLRASGTPVPAPIYRSIKKCVRCKQYKSAALFDNPRDRICLACYDPNYGSEKW